MHQGINSGNDASDTFGNWLRQYYLPVDGDTSLHRHHVVMKDGI